MSCIYMYVYLLVCIILYNIILRYSERKFISTKIAEKGGIADEPIVFDNTINYNINKIE